MDRWVIAFVFKTKCEEGALLFFLFLFERKRVPAIMAGGYIHSFWAKSGIVSVKRGSQNPVIEDEKRAVLKDCSVNALGSCRSYRSDIIVSIVHRVSLGRYLFVLFLITTFEPTL
jgi:hypothetical protein